MTAITELMTDARGQGHLRPFDPRRDLKQVADLVELCFADTLDPEGHVYLRHMRAAAFNPGYLRWASLAAGRGSIPLSGYVWEEDNQIVGNLTLIPNLAFGQSYYLIANVAVHPSYRRKGIARSLTEAAIESVRQRRARAVWLHVRAENDAASDLYRSLGFVERASRTTWHSQPETTAGQMVSPALGEPPVGSLGVKISPRCTADWPAQRLWLNKLYPPNLTWHLPLRTQAVQPGVWGFFYRLFNDLHLRHWSAWREDRLIGVLSWQASQSYVDFLWLAVNPDGDDTAIAPLLAYARSVCSPRRSLSLDYPSGRAAREIQSAGFAEHQTLVWMVKSLNGNK